MEKLTSIIDLFSIIEKIEGNEWVYTNKEKWRLSPEQCAFWLIPESEVDNMPDDEVYESDSGPFLPLSLKDENLHPWMTVDALHGVVQNLKIKNVNSGNLHATVQGINHYLEYDDFLDEN